MVTVVVPGPVAHLVVGIRAKGHREAGGPR